MAECRRFYIAVAGARVRVLRWAAWAWNERLIDIHAFRFLRGPARGPPRRPLSEDQVRQLLATAELRLLEAHANHPPEVGVARGGDRRLHRAEQTCCWSGWPPTPAPAAASPPPYGSTTSTGGCCASTAPSRPWVLTTPKARHDGVHDQRCSSPIGHLGRRSGPHRARRGLHGLPAPRRRSTAECDLLRLSRLDAPLG